MSIAGVRSSLGDRYQDVIALHWIIELLIGEEIDYVQADSTGLPESSEPVTVDDVVVRYKDSQPIGYRFMQAKLHAPRCQNWTIRQLAGELEKAAKQLREIPASLVVFYSQSPFGEFERLLNTCRLHPHIEALRNSGEEEPLQLLSDLTRVMGCNEEEAFSFAQRIEIGPHHTVADWERDNKRNLGRCFADTSKALSVLKTQLVQATTKQDRTFKLDRDSLFKALEDKGLYPGPDINVAEALASFKLASSSTAHWSRNIGGDRIPRTETSKLLEHLEAGKNVLVLGEPGQGKTCVLMEAVDHLVENMSRALLFLRGDEYVHCTDRESLHAAGVPRDLESICSRLAQKLPVIIVVDSLDVLSQSRQYGPLQTILKLLDRLQRIDGVSVAAACRVFDHKYDNRLSSRSWGEVITCQPLGEQVVLDLLAKWGVGAPKPSLLRLLRTPELLKRYKDLVDDGTEFPGDSRAALLEAWLENILRRVGERRAEVEAVLRELAAKLLAQHSLTLPREQLGLAPELSQLLFSRGLIQEDNRGRVGLGHQVVQDVIHAQDLLSRDVTMRQFCQDHSQHPFIRATLRSLLFLLRERDERAMRKQVRDLVNDGDVAFHLKRLVCESIAEMDPSEVGEHLTRWLFKSSPSLFRFFLYRLQAPDWLAFLRQHWEPIATTQTDAKAWLSHFVEVSGRWLGQIPGEVLQYWTDLLVAYPMWVSSLDMAMWRGMDQEFSAWDIPEVRPFFEKMLEISCKQIFMGEVITNWVKATGTGDDILWRFLTRGADALEGSRLDLEKLLNENWVGTFPAELIQQRMLDSEDLLSRAINFLVQWSEDHAYEWQGRLQENLLHYTAWEERHTRGDRHPRSLHHICAAIAEAMRRHADINSGWWRANEPALRHCPEEGIRFMLLEAYASNLPANIAGISAQLTDAHYLRDTRLKDELGPLLNEASPLLSQETLEASQRAMHALYAEERAAEEWIIRIRAALLSWVPAVYRLPETTALLESRRRAWGAPRPSPSIHSTFGLVGSPISCEEIKELSDAGIIRLLRHYVSDDWGVYDGGRLVGGRTALDRILSQAAANDPIRFLTLMPGMRATEVHLDYELAVICGCGDHLSRRKGQLQSSEPWNPVAPLPDEQEVASRLLDLIRNTSATSESTHTLCRAIEPCASTLRNLVDMWLLLLQIEKLWRVEIVLSAPRDGTGAALNASDHLIDALFGLWEGWLESDASMPVQLENLLRECAASPDLGARVHLLRRLPYLLHKNPGLGWELLELALNQAPGHLFKHAWRCFYYNYFHNFEYIMPYLEHMREKHLDAAGKIWGRIIALSFLAGHVAWKNLCAWLAEAPESAWKGATDVFGHNITSRESLNLCLDGLRLAFESPHAAVIRQGVESAFGQDESASLVPGDIAIRYVAIAHIEHGHFDGFQFLPWLEKKAIQEPLEAIEILEALTAKCRDSKATISYQAEHALAALRNVHYEVEESLNPDFLRRSLALMDAFHQAGIDGIDTFFSELSGRDN